MWIYKSVSLKDHNTFNLDYKAEVAIRVKTFREASSLFNGEISLKKPILTVGSGSNILFTEDFQGTIIFPQIGGIRIVNQKGNEIIVSAGAGVIWDNLVEWCVERGFGGIENLSYIPGTVGAVPVQNIGAYGVEAGESIIKVKAVSIADGSSRTFTNEDCHFGYRNSIFKEAEKGKYLITRVWFKLYSNPVFRLNYGSLNEIVNKTGGVNLKNVRQAVISIRQNKLPDPEVIGNAGSFFKNPVVKKTISDKLVKEFPEIPVYKDPSGGIKLAAGWLIEKCGWKGKQAGDAGVHEKQALVLVNHGNASGKDILILSERIQESVFDKFGIRIEREVEVI
jgi:UDP-N-acetylmuramate dehydrogenase